MCECLACGSELNANPHHDLTKNRCHYICNICGHFVISDRLKIDRNMLAPYLFYKRRSSTDDQNMTIFILTQEEIQQGGFSNVIVSSGDDVKAWYPRTFSEKIDKILLTLSVLSKYDGSYTILEDNEFHSVFFTKKYNSNGKITNMEDHDAQVEYIFNYLLDSHFIISHSYYKYQIMILPEGLKRIDELQKNLSNSRDAFVAMSFKDEMKDVKDAICEAIRKAGYTPQIMNDVEHNNQIVPEILHRIRQSKFVVADFTNNNNGAYYEAGYAAGLGKEVIHVCRENIFKRKGHFDIKQKATVLWKTEAELVERLYQRIKATIPER